MHVSEDEYRIADEDNYVHIHGFYTVGTDKSLKFFRELHRLV